MADSGLVYHRQVGVVTSCLRGGAQWGMQYHLLLKLKDCQWHYLGEPYRRVFCAYEKEGLTESRIGLAMQVQQHRITRKGMDKLFELGLWSS